MADASFSCAERRSSPTANMANWSALKVTVPCVPGWRKQTKSTPGVLPAFRNSPLAQSPIICMPA